MDSPASPEDGLHTTDEVARITAPTTAEFVERYLRTGTPIVMTDIVPRWPAFGRWTPESLVSESNDRKHPVTCCSDGVGYTSAEKKSMSLAELVHASKQDGGGGKYYVQGLDIVRSFPDLIRDVIVPGYLDMNRFKHTSLWLGRGTGTPIHWHPVTEVFMAQVYGEKRLTFYSPDQFEILRPRPWNSRDFNESELTRTGNSPDQRTRPLRCTLRPGELLYIPIHWWHLVETDDWSISVVFEWGADGRSRRFWPQKLQHLKGMSLNLHRMLFSRVIERVNRIRFRDRYIVERYD